MEIILLFHLVSYKIFPFKLFFSNLKKDDIIDMKQINKKSTWNRIRFNYLCLARNHGGEPMNNIRIDHERLI
jgi:hypothetical protein